MANLEQKLNILHCAGEVPVWINFVRDLMVVVRNVIVFLLLAEVCWFSDEILAAASVDLGGRRIIKKKKIGTIETAFLRLTVQLRHSAIAFCCSGQQIIEC